MTDNIFSSEQVAVPATTTTANTSVDEFSDLLDAIKNDQGERKYQNVNEALKALRHSQEHIPNLNTRLEEQANEIASLRSELERSSKIDDIVNKITSHQQVVQGGQQPTSESLDKANVIEIVQQSLKDIETQKTSNANVNLVQESLISRFGDKTADVVKAKAAELGTTPELLKELSSKSPQLVLTLFGGQATNNINVSKSSVTTTFTEPKPAEIQKPAKSVLVGASSKDVTQHFKDISKVVHERYNIQ